MVNGLFKEISEEEMMSVNGGCGGGLHGPVDNEPKQSTVKQKVVFWTCFVVFAATSCGNAPNNIPNAADMAAAAAGVNRYNINESTK